MGIYRRSLGKLGLCVPEIGFGTSQIGNTDNQHKGVKYIPPNEAEKILTTALEGGIDFFDTAPNYGNAQKHLNNILKKYPEPVKGLVITSKAGLKIEHTRDFSHPFLLSQLEESLNNLQRECLDLFQLNKPRMRDLKGGGLINLLSKLKTEGRIKHIGLVVGEIETGYEAIKSGKVDCLQILYNLLCQEAEDLICQASKNGLGVIIRSPLNSGILTGTYNVNQKFNDNDARKNYFLGPEFKNRLRVVDEIQKTLNIPDERLLEFSLSFILSNPGVSSVIPAASTTNQMKRFIEFDRNYFSYSTKEWEKIKAIILKMIKPLKQKFQFY